MKAVICPVCNGDGKLLGGRRNEPDQHGNLLAVADIVDCRSCSGKGWVEVGEDTSPLPPVWSPDFIPLTPTFGDVGDTTMLTEEEVDDYNHHQMGRTI